MTNHASPAKISFCDRRLFPAGLFLADFLVSLWVFRPRQYYFFGDSWDALYGLLTDPKTIFKPHNEHFIPLFKAIYLLEYKAFGGNHLPYMIVGLGLHAGVSLLVYLLGRRLGFSGFLSVAATLIFSFSSVHWEVTGWAFEQSFELSTLLALIAVLIFLRDPHQPKVLGWVILLTLLSFWSGPIAVVLPPSFTIYYLLWTLNRSESASRGQILKTMGAIWLPLAAMLATVRVVASFSSLLALHLANLGLPWVPAMINYTLYGAGKTLVLRCLTFLQAPTIESSNLILILFVAWVTISYQKLDRPLERVHFWLLMSLILIPYLAASLIRVQLGIWESAAPRYTYFPMVPLALLMCLCWSGLSRTFAVGAPRIWLNGFGIILLCYYLAFHIEVLHGDHTNLAIERGQEARAYVVAAEKAAFPATRSAGTRILVPEITVPAFIYPPGIFPLWKVFAILELDPNRFVPVREYLEDQAGSMKGNLISDGGFEAPASETAWKIFGKGRGSESVQAAHNGRNGMDIGLENNSAFSLDVVTTCPALLRQTFYTFSIHAKTNNRNALQARVVFKDNHGAILQVSASTPAKGGSQWEELLASGLSPPGTCEVGADVIDESPEAVEAMLDDAILVAHPGTLDPTGSLHFSKSGVFSEVRNISQLGGHKNREYTGLLYSAAGNSGAAGGY